jgi:hypothetical protein
MDERAHTRGNVGPSACLRLELKALLMPTEWLPPLPGMHVRVVLQLHIIVSVAAVLMKVI